MLNLCDSGATAEQHISLPILKERKKNPRGRTCLIRDAASRVNSTTNHDSEGDSEMPDYDGNTAKPGQQNVVLSGGEPYPISSRYNWLQVTTRGSAANCQVL